VETVPFPEEVKYITVEEVLPESMAVVPAAD
jgi:hypothetical protein